MYLTRHLSSHGARWAVDGRALVRRFHLGMLLDLERERIAPMLAGVTTTQAADGPLLAPIEHDQEVWAAGVTYLRSRRNDCEGWRYDTDEGETNLAAPPLDVPDILAMEASSD